MAVKLNERTGTSRFTNSDNYHLYRPRFGADTTANLTQTTIALRAFKNYTMRIDDLKQSDFLCPG